MPKRMSRVEICEEEQLLLSKERTILSFMRTGLAFVTAGAAIAGFFQSFVPAQIVGYSLTLIGFVEVFESIRRLLVKQKDAEKLKRKLGKDFTI